MISLSNEPIQFLLVQFTSMLLVFIGVIQAYQTFAATPVQENLLSISNKLKTLDGNTSALLEEMPKNKGEHILDVMKDYNSHLSQLEELLIAHRNDTLECPEAVELMREGAPDYFHVNIDRDLGMVNFGWQDKGLDEVFKQRSVSIEIWTRINRRSRLIPLEFYTYPENDTYEPYECTLFPLLKEKLTKSESNI